MILKVKKLKKEAGDAFSVIFKRPKGLNFYPGQYLNLKMANSERMFTNSSSPTENFLMITTRRGRSSFKKSLEKLKAGDQIVSDHPAGTYTLDEATPAVMICGGIGITPARSMIKYALDMHLSILITLIYSNSDENFVFKKELNSWQKQLPNLTINYIVTSKNGRLNTEQLKTLLPTTSYQLPIYYLSGPPKMVGDFEKILLKFEVDETNIRTDEFEGY